MINKFEAKEVGSAMGAKLLSTVAEHFVKVGTDTRADLAGQLFFALKGDNFDAHKYLDQAVKSGAAGLVVHDESAVTDEVKAKATVFVVADTLRALQQMATWWRRKLGVTVVAISGSNGKTTTKEFAYQIVSQFKKTKCSPGSFNNHWGVPISLLQLDLGDEVAIIEMGMNHKGELTKLCAIAEPDICLVTNVGRSHVGELGSVEDVAKAKEELYQSCKQALQIFNIDNSFTIDMHSRSEVPPERMMTFSSFRKEADVFLRIYEMQLDEAEITGSFKGVEGKSKIKVFGRHNINNVMGAASIALSLGLSPEQVWAEVPRCKSSWGRNQIVKLECGALVLFDAYNSNPESMSALIKNIFEVHTTGRKIGVFAEMLELGDGAPAMHREIGEMVGNADLDIVWFYGPSKASFEDGLKASGFKKTHYISDSYEEVLANKIGSVLKNHDIVVVKGSRGMKMERVLESWNPVDFKASQK